MRNYINIYIVNQVMKLSPGYIKQARQMCSKYDSLSTLNEWEPLSM